MSGPVVQRWSGGARAVVVHGPGRWSGQCVEGVIVGVVRS
jgi:hypothetical protein